METHPKSRFQCSPPEPRSLSPEDREWPEGRLRRELARKKRCCDNCLYATRPCGKWFQLVFWRFAGLLICANSAEAPGELRGVPGSSVCRNFQVRRDTRAQTAPPEPPGPGARCIFLSQGKHAIVDVEDYEQLRRHKWSVMIRGSKIYAVRKERGKTILMHREIMKPPQGMVVDHIDGNGLNNRRCNLRICTLQQNAWNRRPVRNATSQYLGVYRRTSRPEEWYACVGSGRNKVYLGPFESEVEAALARDRKALERYGEFARLNFPEAWPPERRAAVIAEARRRDAKEKNSDTDLHG